jgi:peptidoglycan/xylan/chitin deacetylase (PgdA/CDA1 family)
MTNLWTTNRPQDFWLCEPVLPDEVWEDATLRALPLLGIELPDTDVGTVLEFTLGEGQFGPSRYKFSFSRRVYYMLKPYLSQKITHPLRRVHSGVAKRASGLSWPIESRYCLFLREVARQVLLLAAKSEIDFRYFWPQNKQFAFILTHDVETGEGQRVIPALADLEESLGFRSSFNFVPERYPLDWGLMKDLKKRGFEIGVHGLKHDSTLFTSRAGFERQGRKINQYLQIFQADGFRSPYTHRNPDWMQLLNIEYDSSFFDTDPFEPMPGGTMSIWPFTTGRFLELPYTLAQDCTLFNVLGKESSAIWQEKLAFIKKYNGMALMLVHPDYSGTGPARGHYADFLKEVRAAGEYWHALPREVASWWKARSSGHKEMYQSLPMGTISFEKEDIHIDVPTPLVREPVWL